MGRVLEMVYVDILDFHRCALVVFRKPSELPRLSNASRVSLACLWCD